MNKEEKNIIINDLAEKIKEYPHFYLTDVSELNAEDTSALRRKCFEKEIMLIVVKNTLLKIALENSEGDFQELYPLLEQPTSIMFSNTGNVPAKLIKEFRKKHDKPVLKAAFVEKGLYIGDEKLETLVGIKSKDELIADVIMLLQSPAKNVISALQSGRNIISGVVKTLADRE
jgi:large subunit ribosomal protein L10